ncbi:cytochrome b/b6 domain-containing protein [Poseidonocella sedimentorum]|uniref:Cytochrome b561 n=1 Tax=Poseidonocella sedimentorum TaxID=871652 RepID=A0A1I6DHA7_9RHOB|nr:cytochrome b/b6 domain-containing protein [Poseidonocella sedimentorum]SFR04823.1 Cytochrome b561 [Poseidonocella sedimentorum]
MAATNTAQSYGAAARAFHWLTALLMLSVIPLGLIANDLAHEIRRGTVTSQDEISRAVQLFSLHKTIGIAIFVTALARLLWALTQPRPVPLHPQRRLETLAAETAHWALYGALIIMPLSGWIHHAATDGYAPILWPLGQSLPLVPKSAALAEAFAHLHELAAWVLYAALAAHIAGALKHSVIDRDATMARMTRGTAAGQPGTGPSHLAPLLAAFALWGATVVIGLGLLTPAEPEEITQAPAARAADPETDPVAASDLPLWTVESGTLGIDVVQMGAAIAGSFAAWQADIAYDPEAAGPNKGTVDVTIDIASLTLGSVTSQAMSAEYFDADTHPTARFAAEIIEGDNGLEAQGTLSLKGTEEPVTLPFTLTIDGDTATMSGRTTLDRRAFGIGQSVSDAGTLGFDVTVSVELTANRAP